VITTQKKIRAAGRIVGIATKLLLIASIAILCFGIVGVVWNIFSPSAYSLNINPVRVLTPLAFAQNCGISTDVFTSIAAQCFFIAILKNVNLIFRELGTGNTPFLPTNIARMKRIALLLILSDIISPFTDAAIADFMSLRSSVSFNYSSEMIILAVVIYCFALIFQYGAELQKQSDETL
jgi:hypothetical protein